MWDDGNTTEQDLWLVAQNKNLVFHLFLNVCIFIFMHLAEYIEDLLL